jgi:hypothetical protein
VGQGQGIAVGEKDGGMVMAAPGGGKIKIALDLLPWFDCERFIAVRAAEGAAVV